MHDSERPWVVDIVADLTLRNLPIPQTDGVPDWVERHLFGLFSGEVRASSAFTGGQTEASRRLNDVDITGYAKTRSAVWPPDDRGATKLSPYIRHGLLDLPTVHDHPNVADSNSYDRFRFRGELLWQDYSRHWYAAFGTATRRGVTYEPQPGKTAAKWSHEPWWREMRCVDATLDELRTDGWMVNQTRMWLASQWAVRAGADWRDGDDAMFRHLLDGSRAANRQGWQWTVGGTRSRSYGFSRRQVQKRSPHFCDECSLSESCPIGGYPGSVSGPIVDTAMRLDLFGPGTPTQPSLFDTDDSVERPIPEAVWLTAESLGDADPALAAYPDLPAHFVFDEPLLSHLRLDAKRLVFITEVLAELATRRDLHVWRGRPVDFVPSMPLAVTHAPVPGFARITAEVHSLTALPWRWLRPPTLALLERLSLKRFPTFKEWCRLTKPSAVGPTGS